VFIGVTVEAEPVYGKRLVVVAVVGFELHLRAAAFTAGGDHQLSDLDRSLDGFSRSALFDVCNHRPLKLAITAVGIAQL
jgi:hypothetical protein